MEFILLINFCKKYIYLYIYNLLLPSITTSSKFLYMYGRKDVVIGLVGSQDLILSTLSVTDLDISFRDCYAVVAAK